MATMPTSWAPGVEGVPFSGWTYAKQLCDAVRVPPAAAALAAAPPTTGRIYAPYYTLKRLALPCLNACWAGVGRDFIRRRGLRGSAPSSSTSAEVLIRDHFHGGPDRC